MTTPALPDPAPPERKKYVRVNTRGKKPGVWKKFRKEFVAKIKSLLGTVVNPASGATVGQEVRSLTAAAFDLAKSKLEKPGLENAELEAKVDYLYAQAAHIRAQAREANARAEAQEIKNAFEKLKLILESAKMLALLTGEDGDEMACFIRDVDAFRTVIDDVAALCGQPPLSPPGATAAESNPVGE